MSNLPDPVLAINATLPVRRATRLAAALRLRLLDLWPAPLAINDRERLRVVLGAGLGLLLTAWLASHMPLPAGLPWLVAPIGASAVLVFAMPASPLAQPWAVIGGNTVSALVGVACLHWLPHPVVAGAAAVALALAAMLALRCLHPPVGAAALLAVLAGVADWRFALASVGLNSLWLVLAAALYHPATGRRYPHGQAPAAAPAVVGSADAAPGFTDDDLNAVLARYNQVLDVPRDDLRELLRQAELQAYGRRMQALRCRDIMRPDPVTVQFGTTLIEAWRCLRQHRLKALPVVDRYGHIVGIVTQADFLRAADLDALAGIDSRLRRLLRPTPLPQSDKVEVVGQIMTRHVRVASVDRPLADLLPLLSATAHRHIPIIGDKNRLVGMISQADLVTALVRVQTTAD